MVADGRVLLTPEHWDHTAIEVKAQARSMVWQVDEVLPQSVLDAVHLFPERPWRME
jgi:hypothetical protein